jgi:DNA polymerase-3 subunit epsilon
MKLPVLPVYYYLDHFTEMLAFVAKTYGPILTDEHREFITRFENLSKDARCLFIRMLNRRGVIFDRSAFKYAEISDHESALDELAKCGHARPLQRNDYAAFIARLSKDALLAGAKSAGLTAVRSSWPKQKLVDHYVSEVAFATAVEYCGGNRYVALDNTKPVEFLLYLYFGKTEDNLKNFTLRDLGIIRINKSSSFSARFTDGEEALACFYYSQVLDRLEVKAADVYEQAAIGILSGPTCPTDYASDIRSRAAHKAGLFFEKYGENVRAQNLYRAGSSPECNERLIRLLYAKGDKTGAEALLRSALDDPSSDEEYIFATDFYARKFGGRRTGICTELLRSGKTITVDENHRGNPEAGAAAVMRRQGWSVFYAENTLWQSLFGLLFWDELFESGRLHSSFDWLPHCLKDRSFVQHFAPQIEAKLTAVRTGEALNHLLRTIAAKWGRLNGVFAWDCIRIDALRALLNGASLEGVAAILRLICEDFLAMRDGFPDLMLAKDGAVSFMEIKAEGDAIRRNQLTRLRQLMNAGIPAEIGKVDYRFDPQQDYVVVDIETTGGWTSGDRITEIGAVKIRNHEVIEEWHSLINPRRFIPARIVSLTGITNEMVRNAPVFAEIANSFISFMGDAIFVAHNVNFDYGFISCEYQRLDRRFRFPKLCTCAGMRRQYPGHRSYSLGPLCGLYEISLDNHHRALCDARAAGHLLNLINRKREQVRKPEAFPALGLG